MTRISRITLISLLGILGLSLGLQAQKLLLLEKIKSPKTIKFYSGDILSFKTIEYPDQWQSKQIVDFIIDEEIILFSEGMVYLKDVTELRSFRGWAKSLSFILIRFGGAWWVMGGIVHLYDENFSFGWDTFIIGASAIVSGFLLKKLFYQRKHKMGKKWRLRMIDINFPLDPYGEKQESR
jgi:hypothetical protein